MERLATGENRLPNRISAAGEQLADDLRAEHRYGLRRLLIAGLQPAPLRDAPAADLLFGGVDALDADGGIHAARDHLHAARQQRRHSGDVWNLCDSVGVALRERLRGRGSATGEFASGSAATTAATTAATSAHEDPAASARCRAVVDVEDVAAQAGDARGDDCAGALGQRDGDQHGAD